MQPEFVRFAVFCKLNWVLHVYVYLPNEKKKKFFMFFNINMYAFDGLY
jgi:hypothetical protein